MDLDTEESGSTYFAYEVQLQVKMSRIRFVIFLVFRVGGHSSSLVGVTTRSIKNEMFSN